jgi:excisionase family DNA binding protein
MVSEGPIAVEDARRTPLVWTEDEFLKTFAVSRSTLLAWIADGLAALRCPDNTFRITASAVDDFVRSRHVETPYLTADEAARYIKRSRQAVYALVKRNRLAPCNGRVGKLLFRRRDLDRFVLGGGAQARQH